MQLKIYLVGFISLLILLSGQNAHARIIERDTCGDGKTDRIGHFNSSGRLTLLEVDSDGDGFFETRQEYENELLALVKRDLDRDSHFECFDFYENGKHTKQERYNSAGKLRQIIEFDSNGNPKLVRKDTSEDDHLDTTQLYERGVIACSFVDKDGNDICESRQEYKDGILLKRTLDTNQDHWPESIFSCDEQGRFFKSEHDIDGDNQYETLREYENNHVVRQEKKDHHNRILELTFFAEGTPLRHEKDTNSDGKRDLITLFDQGHPVRQEQDTNATGQPGHIPVFG